MLLVQKSCLSPVTTMLRFYRYLKTLQSSSSSSGDSSSSTTSCSSSSGGMEVPINTTISSKKVDAINNTEAQQLQASTGQGPVRRLGNVREAFEKEVSDIKFCLQLLPCPYKDALVVQCTMTIRQSLPNHSRPYFKTCSLQVRMQTK